MKKLLLFLSVGLILGFTFLSSCNKDDGETELTPQQERAQIMSGTWTIQSAKWFNNDFQYGCKPYTNII